MRNNNRKTIKKRTLITTISLVLTTAFVAVLLALVITNSIRPNNNLVSGFIDYKTYYDGNQVPIKSTDDKESTTEISMTDAAAAPNTSYSDKVITIATAEELYKFSLACFNDDNNETFLAYNYKLLCNIDYDDYTSNDFIPIGWHDSTEGKFTGTFDGQGYEIKNLEMVVINSGNYSSHANMKYFAMFAEIAEGAEVKNFGLIEPTVTLAYMIANMSNNGVANVAGLNEGTISGVYVKSLETKLIDECGITAAGGYRISGFVLKNTGTISDCYYATNSVYNFTLTDVVEFADVVLDTGGTVENTYFINKSISSLTTESGTTKITYYDDLGAKAKTATNYAGIYVKDEAALCTAISKNDSIKANWSIKSSSKANYEYYYTYVTPVRRKFATNPTIVSTGEDEAEDTVITALSVNITNVADFLFAYELMNNNSFFASSKITYNIKADLNLSRIPASAYAYGRAIGATFKGISFENGTDGTVKLVNGDTNSHPTIYNADILNSARKVSTTGLDTYGLFPYLTGKVEDLNVVVKNQSLNDIAESTNAKAIGGIAGYIELGEVNNVNVYMTLSNTTESKLSEYYLGGICGVLGGEGKVKNSTVTGEFDINADSSYTTASGYMKGVAVGGLIGYIEDSVGDVETLLNAVNIKTNLGSSATYAIGGVIGAGYTREAKYLENIATVSVGTSTVTPTYSKLYVAGIIGRHLGETGETSEQAEVNNFTNQGAVSVYGNSTAALTMVAGIENADIQTSTTSDANVTPSKFVDKANNILFYASAMTNRANITINGTTNTNTLHTSGINVCTGNGFKSVISSIYNLDNNKVYQGTDTLRKTKKIESQTVDMSVSSNYAGLVNVYNKNTKDYKAQKNNPELNSLHLVSAYNLRDIAFTMSGAIAADSIYSAVANGSFIDYDDIRNEGTMTFALSKASATKRNLYINGVFDEISLGNYAKNIYNGGDITITDSADDDVKVDIYVSGICRNNLAVITDEDQNPLNSTFDSDNVGSLDDVINNGKITVTSSDYNKTSLYATQTNTGENKPEAATQSSTTNLNGSVYAAGIVNTNSGIISNAFNLGDIQLDIFAKTAKSEYYAAGIACVMTGDYAQIRDSANNGNIQVINMRNNVNSFVLVGGIFANNTPSSKNNNINEVVSFTINYGTLIAFNAYLVNNNTTADFAKFTSFVGGISAKGICNIVNVLNYGNIYGSEVAGSIVGGFDLSKYDATNIYLANTINYANIYAITKNRYSGSTLIHACYNDLSGTPTFTGTGDYNPTRGEYYYLGSMFGFINFNNQTNIVVRYVINFFNGAYICQEVNQLNIPTNGIDSSTFITVNGSLDKFGGSFVKYAPLTTITDTETGNIGVFSENFIFRRAINGDPTAVNYADYVTDAYIADFFQFVRFDKVNEILLERIGWKNIAYINAAEQLARAVKTMSVFVSDGYAGLTKTTTSVSPSFESSTWYENIDSTLLTNFLTEVLSNNDGNTTEFSSSDLKEILEYILFDGECISDITTTIRASIIDTIVSYYEKEQKDAYELLQTLLYDELLAKVVSGESSDYTAVQTKIRTILSTASNDELESVLTSYLELLIEDTENEILDPLFNEETGDYYLVKKMELIQILLADYSADTLAVIAEELLENTETTNNVLKYINYLTAHTDIATNIYANLFAYNNSNNSYYLSAINEALKKYYASSILEESSFDTDNIKDEYDDVTETYSWINGTKWYYEKDYTELWNLVKNNADFQNYLSTQYFSNHKDPTSSSNYSSIIAKATEYNNTYQTNDGPSEIVEEDTKINGVQLYAGENKNSTTIGSYNINNGGIYRNSNGDATNNPWQPGVKGKDQVIKNRFIYTPDAVNSYATYYYGPYMANGEVFSENWNTTYTYLGYELYNASSAAAKVYVPAFISTNRTITENAIASSNTTDPNKSISPFYWNNYNKESSRYQWVSDYICDKAADDSYNYLYKNYKTSPEGWIVDYYDFTPGKEYTCNNDAKESNTTIEYNGKSVTLKLSSTDGQTKDGSGKRNHPLRDYYLTGYATSSMITGIWFVHSVWYDKGIKGTFLMSKETYLRNGGYDNPITSDFNYYQGLQTTQYTYYQMKDLVKLDGIQTKGKRDGRVDSDETGIISALMTEILSTDAGEKIVINALAEYAKTQDFTSSQAASFTYLTSALRGTSFATNSVTNVFTKQSNTALESISYNNTLSLKDYLDSLIEGVTYTDSQNLSMLGAADAELFKKILLLTLNNEQYDNDSGTNTVTSTDITYFIYKYADYLRSIDPDITDEEIALKFAGVEASDLTALTQLSMLDWDSYINVIGGDADYVGEIGFGGSLNVAEMWYRINYIENSGNSTWANTVKSSVATRAGSYPENGYALPLVVSNEINQAAYETLGSTGTLVANNYEVVAPNNIGYFTGSNNSVKITGKSTEDSFTVAGDLTGTTGAYTDFKIFTSRAQTSGDRTEITNLDANIKSAVLDLLNDPSDLIYTIRMSAQVEVNNPISMDSITVAGNTYNSSISYLPSRCIWFVPQNNGVVKIVLSTLDGAAAGFSLYTVQRNASSDPNNPYHGQISDRTVIESVYTDSEGAIYYNPSDTTGLTLAYSAGWNRELDANRMYYFEIPVKAGYEYAMGNQNGSGPYLMYLDLGQNGDTDTKLYPDLSDIEERYDANYALTSDYASYLVDTNLVESYPTTTTTITVDEPTIILIKAATGGTVTVTGQTTYDVDGTATTIGTVKKNSTGGYRAYYLSGGTYTISATDTTIEEILTVKQKSKITYDTGGSTIYYDNDTSDTTSKKIIFTGTNYTNLSSFNLNIDLSNKILETLLVVYPSMIDSNNEYYFFDDATIEEFTSAQLKEIIKLLAKADYKDSNSALGRLITNLKTSYYDDLLLTINNSDVIYNMITKIINVCDENDYSETEDLIIAAYLGDNFLECADNNLMTQSILYSLLQTYKATAQTSVVDGDTTAGYYNFIIDDTTIAATKFTYFLKHLGVSADLEGYGIFALASSHGIKNGAFIPDNVDLLSMDDPYDKTAKDDYNNSIIKLTVSSDPAVAEVISTSWRDNTGNSSKTGAQGTITYDTSITTSVNHAFRIEMKQLKLAISTTIFELDLDDTSDELDEIFATSSTIDVDNGTITYYVPTSYVDTLKANIAMPISYIKYAETATYKTNNNNTTTIDLTGGTVKDGVYEVYSAITVTAEDTTVINNYTIRIIGVDLNFEIDSFTVVDIKDDNVDNKISYNGGTVALTISTTNIPNSFDFKSFFSIVNGTTTYKATDTNPGFVFNSSTRNNGIVTGVTNGSGSATLVMDVLSSLPGGTEVFTIKAFNITRTVSIDKNTNTENYITKIEFEGKTPTIKDGSYTSEIKFGRAYDYSELTDYTSDNFYLSAFEISDNATVESITATYSSISGNRIQYVVTFEIKSESGDTATYTHTLSEMNQFTDTYANLYKDGLSLAEADLHKENFVYNNTNMQGTKVSLNYTSGVYAAAMFNRGETPEYRIKYILTNFYTLGDDISYHITTETLNNGTSVSESYLGLTATFSEDNEPGTFKYEYVYESKGTWNDGEYKRTYTFPALYIILGYSRDALLHRLTFIDQSVIIGNTASVMKTNGSTSAILAGTTTTAVDNKEVTYDNIFKTTNRDIEIKGKTIRYTKDTDATSVSDYYAIGTVANADLNYYSPTFEVEDHGLIFQYTTIKKLTEYGADNNQTNSDATILSNHDTLLLYIPFEKNGKVEVLLVELQEVQKTSNGITKNEYIWKNVYAVNYDGEETGNASSYFIGSYSNSKSTLEMMSDPSLASIAGYTLSDECGKLSSSALYMDYVGTPLENHFWYVSYVVFSEAALHGELDEGNMRYYHISIVDAVNTIYFEVELYAPVDFATIEKNQTLYMTISENIYNDTVKTSTRQISGYLVAQKDSNDEFITGTKTHNNGLVLYKLRFKLQTLPRGYFYFSIDLPNGYAVTATTDMKNQLYRNYIAAEDGSFLPYTSIITKTVQLEFVVREGENESAKAWAIATSDIYTRNATYIEAYNKVAVNGTLDVSSIIPSDATGTATWKSSDTDVLTVSSSGVVTGKAAGVAVVTVTKGNSKFKTLVYVE